MTAILHASLYIAALVMFVAFIAHHSQLGAFL